ncbi:uncharacterized protein LACBIDRAFT_321191 [Laccaria bicolor S238N-H82]|uniref:Predicted protein n=1 Tax=Laccaria bicolor (strain S238N-H82 / ATCC MYA-4686) TaxID=486041 RepID=B0CP12_LACBS|nr:uncharacterized protein LACBIDRAFT_321191 [Laccaria bicolor S238N-H82]EDR15393.1 predicted protein [Laccaria bicolor S238N-H82]|eukprot:XP_001873601.1 predicted protein [Laccaria bicolor S238N-H82]
MSTLASVDPSSAKAPILTQGNISPAVMMDFENAALDFFVSKSIPADKQVTMIIPGIKDLHIRDWITAERARIVVLPFADFITEMRANYLPPDWEDQVRNEILTSTLAASKTSFWNWSQKLLKLNCLLRGMPSAFDEAALRNHLEAHLDDELKAKVRHSDAHKDKVFKTWVIAVRLLDEARALETKRQHELIEETLTQRQSKRQNTNNDTLRGASRRANTSQSNTSASGSSSSSYTRLPTLTETERNLLHEHDGCTKCCRFYADHRSRDCPNGFPAGKNYKTLTTADAMTAKKGKAVAKPTTKPVAATSASIENIDSDDDISAATAILPNSLGEYNSNSDGGDLSRREVSPLICGKHLVWNCQAHSLIEDFPVKTRVLIDNGTHLVLIRPELVERLGLKMHDLAEPELVDVTFNNQQKKTKLYHYVKLFRPELVERLGLKMHDLAEPELVDVTFNNQQKKTKLYHYVKLFCPELVERLGLKMHDLAEPELVDVAFNNQQKKTKLYHYVKLSLTSLDSSWTSCTVRAVVTPGLCAPIILGLPWLTMPLVLA